MNNLVKLLTLLLCSMITNGQNVVQTPTLPVNWVTNGFTGLDLGLGAEGDLYVIGTDGLLYYYNLVTDTFTAINSNLQLSNLVRVDVDDDGTPFVINGLGDTFYLDFYNKWVKLPGCAKDIGIGRGNEVWKIGCDARSHGGFGIWRLFCKNLCSNLNERECVRFRQLTSQLNTDDRECNWVRIEGEGIKIDVGPDGFPYIIAPGNVVMKYEDTNWLRISGKFAKDLTVSNEGLLFIIGLNNEIYRSVCEELGTWQLIEGSALAITASAFSQPAIISSIDNRVYITFKFDYN